MFEMAFRRSAAKLQVQQHCLELRQKEAQSANKMPLGLNATAASLMARGIKGSLYEARGSFYWRVCVADSEGQGRTRKIPLRLRTQPSTLTLAETRIAELSALIQLEGGSARSAAMERTESCSCSQETRLHRGQGGQSLRG
ncbi:putative phage integrase domain protein [Synechococcus sp. BIOS-E4-1]|nr:putative phage integrase domain protein [Synechococcus sp. BIOS-E4-1]